MKLKEEFILQQLKKKLHSRVRKLMKSLYYKQTMHGLKNIWYQSKFVFQLILQKCFKVSVFLYLFQYVFKDANLA